MQILVGTDKGLIEYSLLNDDFKLKEIHFLGFPIGGVNYHQSSGSWRAAVNHKHWGPKIHHSTNGGKQWQEIGAPKFPLNIIDKHGNKTVIKNIWEIAHATNADPDEFYVGVEPAAIFRTKDGGSNYEFIRGLWEHPSRSEWLGGGKGTMDPFLHSITIDPLDKSHIYVGISCAGVFETWNGGITWDAINKGLIADYLPNPKAEVGHDPHTLKMSKSNNKVIWQQNHCGIFKTSDGGKHWDNISDGKGIANYGFAMAIDEENDNRAWVIPSHSDSLRIPHDNALCVCITEDGGKTWLEQREGLPQEASFDIALRHALDIKEGHLVFGTNNGNLYHSPDYGAHWETVSQNLSTVRSVKII